RRRRRRLLRRAARRDGDGDGDGDGDRSHRPHRWMRTVGDAPVNSARTVTRSFARRPKRSPRLSPVGSKTKRTSCCPGSRVVLPGHAPRATPSTVTRVPGSPRNVTDARPEAGDEVVADGRGAVVPCGEGGGDAVTTASEDGVGTT